MADKSVRVVLSAAVGGYKAAMEQAAAATNRVTSASAQLAKADGFRHMERAALLGTAAVVGAVGSMVKAYADFDAQMSAVGAATGASAADLDRLREAAMAAGAEFGQFSSSDAAGAIEELGKAGLSTAQIIGGGLRGAMALAAADGMAVAEAAELTANALAMFSLDGSKATHVADLLAQGSGAATGSAHDLGMALSQAGAVAASMGMSVDDTATALALFAKNGIKGSDAGTSLKTMLMRLANPTKESAAAMSDLGIAAFDASGNFVGMRDLSAQLADKTKGMSTEARNAALSTIFGSDAMRVAAIAAKEGASGYDDMASSMEKFGSANDMAKKRTDNLKGDLAELSGAWENFSISMGESANGPLRDLTQHLTSLLELAGRHQTAVAVIGGITAGLVGLGATAVTVVKAAAALREVRTALIGLKVVESLPTSLGSLNAGLGALKGSAGSAALALGAVAAAGAILAAMPEATVTTTDEYAKALDQVAKNAPGAGKALDDLVSTGIDNWGYRSADQIHNLTDAFEGLKNTGWLAKHIGNIGKALSDMSGIKGGDTRWTTLVDNMRNLDAALASMDVEKQAGAFAHVAASAREAGYSAEELAAALPETSKALQAAAADVGVTNLSAQELADWMGGKVPASVQAAAAAAKAAGKDVSSLTDANKLASESAKAAAEAAIEQRKAYLEMANAALQLSGSQMGVYAATDDAAKALKENGRTLDITTEKGRENRAALDGIAAAALRLVESQQATGKSSDEMAASMEKNREAFISMATQMGMTRQQAAALADQYGLIPKDVKTNFGTTGIDASIAKAQALKTNLAGLRDKTITVTTVYRQDGSPSTNVKGVQQARAGGGAVFGPGTATSDSILTALSNGEFVVRTWAAKRIGYDRLAAMNREGRIPERAGGGPVGTTYRTYTPPPVVNVTAPSGAASMPTFQISGPDPAAVVGEAMSVWRHEQRAQDLTLPGGPS